MCVTLYPLFSFECGKHELKARERKEELEQTVADKQTLVAELTGAVQLRTTDMFSVSCLLCVC